MDQNTPFVNDRAFLWRPGRLYIPASSFTGLAAGIGVHTGAPIEAEISTIGDAGFLVDTAGDMVVTTHMIPSDFDRKFPLKVRVHWSSGSADVADTIDFIVLYSALIPEVTAQITPATALSKTIAQDTTPAATAYTRNRTSWGVINGNTISKYAEDISWLIEMDAFAVGLAEAKLILGLELMYTPRKLYYGDGMAVEAKMPRTLLGNGY